VLGYFIPQGWKLSGNDFKKKTRNETQGFPHKVSKPKVYKENQNIFENLEQDAM
jgi:hypothetical protein